VYFVVIFGTISAPGNSPGRAPRRRQNSALDRGTFCRDLSAEMKNKKATKLKRKKQRFYGRETLRLSYQFTKRI
jgi:hypothetical protein